jgi:hypothetical protein
VVPDWRPECTTSNKLWQIDIQLVGNFFENMRAYDFHENLSEALEMGAW